MDFANWESQLTEARVRGSGPEELAEAVVDGTGRLVDLKLDPRLLRRSAGAAAKEILGAVSSAQEAVRTQNSGADGFEALVRQASADAEAYRFAAERQMEELNTLVGDLLRGRERAR